MMLTFFIVFNLCTKIVISSRLAVFRGHSDSSTPNSESQRQLLCISDNPKDAMVWNTDNVDTNFGVTELSYYPKKTSQHCGIDETDSPNCFPKWTQQNGNWKLTSSLDDPMGPIYDSRWEHFPDYKSQSFKPIRKNLPGIYNAHRFKSAGALVFSVRGLANMLISVCSDENYADGRCLELTIGGGDEKNGVIIDYWRYENEYHESLSRTEKVNLNAHEWKTFILTFDTSSQILELFDPNTLIVSYKNDIMRYNYNYVNYKSYDKDMLFRFHDYSYILTSQPGAILSSPKLLIENPEGICIDMLVGLCKTCKLIVNLMNKSGGLLKKTTIVRSTQAYQNIDHNLPVWQHEKIKVPNVTQYSTFIMLEFITVSLSKIANEADHWAITKLEECLPEGTIKRAKLTTSKECNEQNCTWPTVKCQKFSYDNPHSEVVDPTLEVSIRPNSSYSGDVLQHCSNLQSEQHCPTDCNSYFENNCSFGTMCTENHCFCTQDYEGDNCQKRKSRKIEENLIHFDPLINHNQTVDPESMTSNIRHAYWAIPLVLLLIIIIGGASFYYTKKSKNSRPSNLQVIATLIK